MANAIPANYPRPDPGTIGAGEPVSDPPPQTLLTTMNWFSAAPVNRIAQGWNHTDDICRRRAAMPVMPAIGSKGSHVACWPVPAYGVRTDLEVCVFGHRDGATGTVRFRSVQTGDTVDLALGLADAWSAIGALTVDCSSGEDEVEMYLAGDTVADVHVFYANGDFPALVGALATPGTGEPTPFDEDELGPDEPWSSDVSLAVLDNLEIYLGWLASYFTWSGVQNTSSGTKASYGMPAWNHQVISSVHRGQLRAELTWEAKLRAANLSGSDELVVFAIGGVEARGRSFATVAAPAGEKTVTVDLQPADIDAQGQELRGVAEVDHPLVFLTVFGDPSITTAELRSISIRGV